MSKCCAWAKRRGSSPVFAKLRRVHFTRRLSAWPYTHTLRGNGYMCLVVRKSPIAGFGVFTDAPISTGEVIHCLSGESISLLNCAARVILGRLSEDSPLATGRFTYIQLDDFSVRFNHSSEPNAAMRGESELFAHRDIAPGEEITYDYSLTVLPNPVTWFWRMPCNCGAESCRGVVKNIRQIPFHRIEELTNAKALQDFVIAWVQRNIYA